MNENDIKSNWLKTWNATSSLFGKRLALKYFKDRLRPRTYVSLMEMVIGHGDAENVKYVLKAIGK